MSTSDSLQILKEPRNRFWLAALLAVLAVAAFLRFDGLGEPSLWLDEVLHYGKAKEAAGEPWYRWLSGVSADRENGSLYYAGQVVGLALSDSEMGVRLVPALLGLATVLVFFLVVLSATESPRAATVAAALLAVSPLHVYYSREGRPYAAVMLLATLLLWAALENRRLWLRWAAYALCIAAAYLGAVAAPVLVAFGALAALDWLFRRQSGSFVLASGCGVAVALLLFPAAEKLGGAAGGLNQNARWEITEPLSGVALDRLLASLTVSGLDRGTANGLSYLMLALALWGAGALLLARPRPGLWMTGMAILPIVGWLVLLVAFDHWYNVRYTSAGLPAFLALVALGLVDLASRLGRIARRGLSRGKETGTGKAAWRWAGDGLLLLALGVLLVPAWQAVRAEPWEKPDWRGVAGLIDTLAAPGEAVITRGTWAETCLRHYLEAQDSPLEIYNVNYDPARAEAVTAEHPQAWVVAAGYRETPEFKAWAQGLDPVLRQRLANLQVLYHPDFAAFVGEPGRLEKLAALLEKDAVVEGSGDPSRQEFEGSELLLGTGWSYPERAPDGMTFRWAMGEAVQVALLPLEPGKRHVLRLRLLPFPSPDRPVQTVAVTVNGEALVDLKLEAGWSEVSTPPFESGEDLDVVTFTFGWSQSPRELDPSSQDPRRLAVAFDFVEVVAEERI